MPGGFENSAMKSSFSLSSLQPSSGSLESPEHVRLQDRPYSSLRKKPRRDPETELRRRSWGSRDENKDEFWAALKIDYQYLMDSNLIDSCKEARRDLQYGSPTHEWSYDQFLEQFNELNTWLSSIHEAMYRKEETIIDRQLRLTHMEEMQRNSYKRKLFNNQSGRVVARMPNYKQEVAWKVQYINSKWERLEQAVTPRKRLHTGHLDVCTDVEHELSCLRKWIKETEQCLETRKRRNEWTFQELEEKAKEHEVVQRDAWTHGKILSSVVKLCTKLSKAEESQESISSWVRGRRQEPSQAVRFAHVLQRRWQILYLDLLERECHIKKLLEDSKHQPEPLPPLVPVDSDEEPLTKQRRLCRDSDIVPFIQEDDDDDYLMETADIVDVESDMEIESNCRSERLYCTMETDQADGMTGKKSGRKLFLDETPTFNRALVNAPNCATYYFKHSDTETEQNNEMKSESSEEEWTYTEADTTVIENVQQVPGDIQLSTPVDEDLPSVPSMPSMDPFSSLDSDAQRPKQEIIKRLVNQAEEIVASPTRKARVFEPLRFTDPETNTRITRIQEWVDSMDAKAVGDSCDASGEYTTEDDEGHDKSDFLGFPQDNCSTIVPSPPSPDQPKVVLRPKRRDGNLPRPWSMSVCSGSSSQGLDYLQISHSNSESAIHQLSTQCSSVKAESSVNTICASSSTVEDTCQTQEGSGGGYSSNSLRKRKGKLRKRNLTRKSESGSECFSPQVHSDGSHATLNSPLKQSVKSSSRRSSADKQLLDSPHRRFPTTVVSSSSSEIDSAEESEDSAKLRKKAAALPAFRIGPDFTLNTYSMIKETKIVSADSSYSEQAWDNYQEKYMSEAYSEEAPDPEAARKLLDFGDDYRNFLDSQSDCASSLGRIPQSRRRRVPRGNESDSDLDELWHVVSLSQDQYRFTSEVLKNHLAKASPARVFISEFTEVGTTCQRNMKCLKNLLESIQHDTSLLTEKECKEIQDLVDKWEGLKKDVDDLQSVRSFQREMAGLRNELNGISNRETAVETELENRSQLDARIQEVKSELSYLRELKNQLLQVNVAVHRFLTDSGHPPGPLKDEVADLYRLWDETNQKVRSELSSLQEVGVAWQQFESHLEGLQLALRGDQETLRLLDIALQRGGAVSPDLASSVRDLAKVLSEKQDCSTILTQEDTVAGQGTEGSLSDSGISDSGSEQDLSERERKLAALRRLVRHLEAVLAPGSAAIANMSKRIEQTESELRGLQQTCRDLIVRTAVCAEVKSKSPEVLAKIQNLNGKTIQNGTRKQTGDGKDEKKSNWLWRVIRAALPFQLAILTLICIACLLEPHCCDSMNNLNLSISPQLRYVKGPPPV